jgi:hypothetical protein
LREAETSGAVQIYRPGPPDYVEDEKAALYNEKDLRYWLAQIAGAKPKVDTRPATTPDGRVESVSSPEKRPAGRRGPKPGTLNRYKTADRKLFPEIQRLLGEGVSLTSATQSLADNGRIGGAGTPSSRARRVAKLFQTER